MIPPLTSAAGQPDLLLPPGIHDASVADIQSTFVDPFPASATRLDIFVGWTAFRSQLRGLVPITAEFLDGSFVTSRENPADVDASLWFSAYVFDSLGPAAQSAVNLLFAKAKKVFRVDAYPVPACGQEHPDWIYFSHTRKWTRNYWKSYRNPSKVVVPGTEKGYLRVTP